MLLTLYLRAYLSICYLLSYCPLVEGVELSLTPLISIFPFPYNLDTLRARHFFYHLTLGIP